jgi:hypothetical protein
MYGVPAGVNRKEGETYSMGNVCEEISFPQNRLSFVFTMRQILQDVEDVVGVHVRQDKTVKV